MVEASDLVSSAGVTLRSMAFATRWSLRADAGAASALEPMLGLRLPERNLRSASANGRHALKLGPDEWLLLTDGPCALDERAKEASGILFSLVDVSHRSIGLEIVGPSAAAALNAGVPLDLSEAAFPAGMCTRTVLGKSEIVLWRPSTSLSWRLDFWRSYSDYVITRLNLAIADLAAPVGDQEA